MRAHKGTGGRALERLLGVVGDTRALDFRDGELKTLNCDRDGFPLESVAVTRVSNIDPLLERRPFAATRLYEKLRRVLMLGIWRGSEDPATWRIAMVIRFEGRAGTEWYERLDAAYEDVGAQLRALLGSGADFRTVSSAILQMRVRDSRPYRPMVSRRLGRQVSDKGVGWYLRPAMLSELVEQTLACRG